MKIFKISKKNGKSRTIYSPDPIEKAALRDRLEGLHEQSQKLNVANCQHGFQKGRNPVTNAMQHVGYEYTLNMDLSDFFDSVKPSHFSPALMSPFGFQQCFPDGAARQGLPTSPILANIAASKMDAEILGLQGNGRFGKLFVYTRYADDLTFSFDFFFLAETLKIKVKEIVERHGFKLNNSKTKLQCAKAGRRMVTGVAVDTAIHVPREIKRRLRAAKHQHNNRQVEGLTEWAKLKVPKQNSVKLKSPEEKQVQNTAKNEQALTSAKQVQSVENQVVVKSGRKFNFDE